MAQKGDNIYQRRDARWEGRFVKKNIAGRPKFGYVYSYTYGDVKEKLTNARYEYRHQMQSAKPERVMVKDLSADWLKSLGELKPATLSRYSDYLRCYILPALGERSWKTLANKDIAEFSRHLMINGGMQRQGLSAKTVSEVLGIVKRLRKYAVSLGLTVGFTGDCTAVRQKKHQIRVLSPAEQRKLTTYLAAHQNPVNIGIAPCLKTGLRIGELCALKWEAIDLSRKVIYINSTMQRIRCTGANTKTKVVISAPKSESSTRAIPLPPDIYRVLREIRKPNGFLLTGERKKVMEPRTLANRFKSVLKACGLREINFHVLRHTFASSCIEAGVDAKCLSEILGHANVGITLNRYVHTSMCAKRANMAKLYALG